MFEYNLILLKIERYYQLLCAVEQNVHLRDESRSFARTELKNCLLLTYKAFLCFPRFFPFKQEGKSKRVAIACLQKLKAMLMFRPAVPTSNFSCAELNANELKQRTS